MKITTLLGSARKKGNTATVLQWVEDELTAKGHAVERIYLSGKTINGCLGCAKCRENPGAVACVQKDDAIAVLERMVDSDAVLYTSPLYFWGFSAQIKALIDRGFSLAANFNQPGHTSLLKGKRLGVLVTGAGPFEENAEGLFTAFDRIVAFLLARKAGELFVEGCTAPEALNETVKQRAIALAAALTA